MQASDISGAIGSVLTCLAKVSPDQYLDNFALSDVHNLQVNALVALKEPWKLDSPLELASVLSHSIEGLRKCAILLSPVIPSASRDMLAGLGYEAEPTWTEVQTDRTITGMRNILDAVQRKGPQSSIFPRLKAIEKSQSY